MKKALRLLLILLLSFTLIGCSVLDTILDDIDVEVSDGSSEEIINKETEDIDKDGYYTSKEDVSLYIHTYNQLPNNYITKKEAMDLGWESNKGNLWDVTDKKSIGGDRFGNREKKLPTEEDREYYECDVNYNGGYRGSERLVYSNDGLIYYTKDHYNSFDLLYGDE